MIPSESELPIMDGSTIVTAALNAWQRDDKITLLKHLAQDFIAENWFPMPISVGTFMLIGHVFHAAFPDWAINIDHIQQEGDQVDAAFHSTGTHTGILSTIIPGRPAVPPTGRSICLPGHIVAVIRDDHIASIRSHKGSDGIAMLYQQLGIALPPAH
jgi:predicted ester cyclase